MDQEHASLQLKTPGRLATFRIMGVPVRLHFNPETLGSTKNFEKAIGLCAGDVIALSDQDDYWLPEKLARVEEALSSALDVGMVFSDAEIVDESLHPLGCRLWQYLKFERGEQKSVRGGNAFDLLLARNIVVGATMAFRSRFKELILPIPDEFDLRFDDGRILIHDGWLSLLISATAGVAVIDEPLIMYRQHPKQQVGAKSPPGAEAADGGGLRAALTRQNFYSAEIGQLEAKQAQIEAQIPERLRRQFWQVAKQRNNVAVARVDNDSCSACRTRVRAMVAQQLKRGEIVPCEGCHRILYVERPAS